MQISLDINSGNINQSFRSKLVLNKLGFGVKTKGLNTDTIEIPRLKLNASRFYSQICKKIANPTVEEITKIVDNFSERYLREDVLAVMHTLTQYSNMDSIFGLYNIFKDNSIKNFRGFGSYDYAEAMELSKDLSTEDKTKMRYQLPVGYLPTLSDIFGYFFDLNSGKCGLPPGKNHGTILDSSTIKILQEYKKQAPLKFKLITDKPNKFFYLKNFDGGYNIFEQHQNLEILTEKYLEKLAGLKEIHPEHSSISLINILFNKENLDLIRELGINYKIIESNVKRNPTPKSIAENLSQKIPSEKEFIDVIEKFIPSITTETTLQNSYLNDIIEKFKIYTYKEMGEKLQQLNSLIEKEVMKSKGSPENVYYFVPNYRKSYGLIAYMYQKINNVPKERFIDWDAKALMLNKEKYLENFKKFFNKDTTIVILDDASISGESLLSDLNTKNYPFIKMMFGTLFATPEARGNLSFNSGSKIISVDSFTLESSDPKVAKNSHFNNHSMLLFPYNAPDNNISVLKELVEKFYPAKGFVLEAWDY